MKLYDLLNKENSKLNKDEKDLIKKLYEKHGLYKKHFTFDDYTYILDFLNKYNIEIYDETKDLSIFEEIIEPEEQEEYINDFTTITKFENVEILQNIFACDLFRENEYKSIFHLYFKVIYSYYKSNYNRHYITYQIKHFTFQ